MTGWLRITLVVDTGGSSISARCRVIAQAREGRRRMHALACKGCTTLRQRMLHVQMPRASASARTHTHTHSLTLPAKAASAGILTCSQEHIHLASRRTFTEHSFVLGLGRVAGSKRGIYIAYLSSSYYTYYVYCA